MADVIDVFILPDGRMKTQTGEVSAANHMLAEKLFRELAMLSGGESKREANKKEGHSHHGHTHSHDDTVHA